MYTIKRFDIISGEWNYMNTYETYDEAYKALEELTRRYKGKFKIF